VPSRIELTGQRFGRLEVKSYDGLRNAKAYWRCVCECGAEVFVRGELLRNGNTASCGCYRAEFVSESKRKHGMVGTPEYNAYSSMLGRCFNKNNHKFPHYGGRGIKVCDRWRKSFVNFYADMGSRPDGCSLDRIDVNRHYEPNNCRWATITQQAQNTTSNINITYQGRKKCLTQWAREYEVPMGTAYKRFHRGLPFEQVFAGRAS
jgi:hypothetical protein